MPMALRIRYSVRTLTTCLALSRTRSPAGGLPYSRATRRFPPWVRLATISSENGPSCLSCAYCFIFPFRCCLSFNFLACLLACLGSLCARCLCYYSVFHTRVFLVCFLYITSARVVWPAHPRALLYAFFFGPPLRSAPGSATPLSEHLGSRLDPRRPSPRTPEHGLIDILIVITRRGPSLA